MNKECIVYKEVMTIIQRFPDPIAKRTSRIMGTKICGLCRVPVQAGDTICLLGNNDHLFPNAMVHEQCLEGIGSHVRAVQYLAEDYQASKRYAQWF